MAIRGLERFQDVRGRCNDPERIRALARNFDMDSPNDREIELGRSIAAELISPYVASARVFAEIEARTGASIFVYRENEEVTGMLGLFLLTQAGLDQLEAGQFNPVEVDLTFVCPPHEPPAACYGWGFAATTKAGGSAAVKTAVALQQLLFWALPTFTRTATADGERVILGKMGYEPAPFNQSGLVWIPPQADPRKEVAR